MTFTAKTWTWVASVILLSLTIVVTRHRRNRARLPPGPTPLPILGNILDFPRGHFGREFATLSKRFGDVVHLSLLGQDIIVLGSLEAARDLLDKRSANYSNRPTSVMVQLVGYDWLTALKNYGQHWRQQRRAIQTVMAPNVLPRYEAIQMTVTRNFLRVVLHNPQGLASHIKFAFTSIIMEVVYGIEVHKPNDKYFKMVERMAEIAQTIAIPGNFLVEAFPSLRYLPSWFPGGGFKKWANHAKRDLSYIVDSLFEGAKDRKTGDSYRPSVVSVTQALQDSTSKGEQAVDPERMCKDVTATLYLGAADTGMATMGAFFFVMARFPEAQKKAQKELDAVVGTERLPEFSDCPSLPYVNALVRELLRWHPAITVGLPHGVVADDEYNGHFIPGGATVFANIWAILRDPKVYAQPDDFIPERFLDSARNLDIDGRDPADVTFGFGRRVCPGRQFAESLLFILCASVLSAFEIGPPVGEDGTPMEFKWKVTDNWLVPQPTIHGYTIKPRSAHVERLVEPSLTD